MSAQWILFGAQVGTSLLSASSRRRAARRQEAEQIRGAVIGGTMERMQINRTAREQESFRRGELARSLGAQRAGLAAAGVAGGRTMQLLDTTSQYEFRREQDFADFQHRMAVRSSEFRQEQTIRAARAGASAARSQAGLDLAGDLVNLGQQGFSIWEAGRAGG